MCRLAWSIVLGCSALAVSGCGNPQNRHDISGEVKFKGVPLNEGIISFFPMEGQGTSDGAGIADGKYRIPLKKGLSPGKYKVTIVAGDGRSGAGDASPDPPKGSGKPGVERIPPEYNIRSKIVKEVTKGGPNKFDFDIP